MPTDGMIETREQLSFAARLSKHARPAQTGVISQCTSTDSVITPEFQLAGNINRRLPREIYRYLDFMSSFDVLEQYDTLLRWFL